MKTNNSLYCSVFMNKSSVVAAADLDYTDAKNKMILMTDPALILKKMTLSYLKWMAWEKENQCSIFELILIMKSSQNRCQEKKTFTLSISFSVLTRNVLAQKEPLK